ncbi:hypothetical protein PPERSA_09454 [Pseudocohnilembus persalinus]|uniref:Uncharacterized protein n=1 Tax=Pseudocohnilembus persalinus TaxID=266149 RepID=A0A0V0Q9S5_PSEPJ|nr:hypothetical protein PPERSA_09454 [Pseudocohnilembus persalinus]|eukprot:KRW98929.1 hypothetical protein PPERSA_09454 [Pseudocohnilembus persalinus]
MKNQREIKRLKKDCFNFKTVVTASQNVTQLLDLYNLTPAEFFRPFTDYKNEEIDIQTYKGFQKIQNLKIEFIDRQAYNVPIDQSFAYYQNKILQKNQPPLKYEDSELQIQGQKQAGIEFKPINTNTEWFEESSSNILQMCQYKPGINFFDQPVCLLYCAHVKDQNPEKTLQQMKFLRGSKDQKNNDELNQKEQIIRHLADIHFILGEYETSTFFYKALIDELNKKEDIAFANAVDAFALSSLLGEQNQMALNDKKQLLSYLESATQIYIKAGSHQQFSLKCLVYYIHALHILKQNDQKRAKFLWNCCFSVKDKHPYQLLHIIFLEQTALLYYNIGKSRHFCLHTLFSGYKYGQNGYKYHAINCFLQIIPFYDLVNWPQLKDLIYKFLVKYSQETGNFDQAIKFLKFNFNNTSQKDKDELRHEQIISDTIKLLTSLDSQNLNQDQKELLFFEGESIKIPFAIQKTLDIKVQDEIVSYNSIQDHSVLSSINYDYLNQQNSKLKQANSYEQVQNQVWAEKGEILIKSENKGFLEIQRDRNILKCMGVQHIEQKQKIYDNVTANPNLNQKNYRMAYKGEMIQVSIILENNLKYPYEVKDLVIIYDFYDKDNNLVYTNSIVDELNQKKQQNVQNDPNGNQKSQNLNTNKNDVNLLDMDLNQNEQEHKQQQITNLLDADDTLNQEKQQQNQKSEQVWSIAPVDYSKLATEDVQQNREKQQTQIQNQEEHTNLLDDPNKEQNQKSYQFNIESILILDPQWALKDIPYNSKNDFQNKKYVQLLVTNDKNHDCQNNSFNSTNQEEKSDFDNQQQFDPEIEKDVSPTKKQKFTKAKNNSYIAIDEQFVKVINIDKSLNSPSIQKNSIMKQLNYEQNQSNENGIGDLLSKNDEEKFDGSINEQIQQTQQINQKLVQQFQGYEKGFLNPQIILAFVNQDHQEYLKTRTKEEIQQKLLQQCSFEKQTVQLIAVFYQPGIYDISRFKYIFHLNKLTNLVADPTTLSPDTRENIYSI